MELPSPQYKSVIYSTQRLVFLQLKQGRRQSSRYLMAKPFPSKRPAAASAHSAHLLLGLPEAHLCWHKPYRMKLINFPTLTCCSRVMMFRQSSQAERVKSKSLLCIYSTQARYKATPSAWLQEWKATANRGLPMCPQKVRLLYSVVFHHEATSDSLWVWMLHLTHTQLQVEWGEMGLWVKARDQAALSLPVPFLCCEMWHLNACLLRKPQSDGCNC